MIDNINPYNINTFLENKASEEIIGGDKIKRQGLICAIFSNLIKITDYKYISVMLKHFLISDYDQ